MAAASAASAASPAAGGLPLRSGAQLGGLVAAFVACLVLTPVQINRAFGLPAHPLLLHFPVVFDPLLALLALVLVAKPAWRERWGLGFAAFAFTALILLLVASDWLRASVRGPHLLRARATAIVLSALVGLFAVATGFLTVRTGHLGAKSAWQREGRGGFPGGGPQGGQFPFTPGGGQGGAPGQSAPAPGG